MDLQSPPQSWLLVTQILTLHLHSTIGGNVIPTLVNPVLLLEAHPYSSDVPHHQCLNHMVLVNDIILKMRLH